MDKIREALNVYLQAPNSLRFDTEIGRNRDMAALQFQAQIHFLKSQYMLALATVQNQQETIEALQLSKYQKTPNIFFHVKPLEAEKKEELISGKLSVGKMEWYGVEVNWGEMVRQLKDVFLIVIEIERNRYNFF